MEFIKESTSKECDNFKDWMDRYIDTNSRLYKQFELMLHQIPYSNQTGEINILSPYFLWLEILRSPDIKIEDSDKVSSGCCSKKSYRQVVLYNDEVVAVIDKIKVNTTKEYRYVSIPYKCLQSLLREYVEQLC